MPNGLIRNLLDDFRTTQYCRQMIGGTRPSRFLNTGASVPQSPLRLIRQCIEYQSSEHVMELPKGLRGIYVLYREVPAADRHGKDGYQVVYVGMATKGSIRGRLRSHRRTKQNLWTHFSVYEVWDNIRDDEIAELEGLFRHLYRRDPIASRLNKQRGFKPIRKVRHRSFEHWLP